MTARLRVGICSLAFTLMPVSLPASASDLQSGLAAYNSGNYAAACQYLERAVTSGQSADSRTLYMLANALVQSGQRSKAAVYYRACLQANPGEPLAGYCRQGLQACGAAAVVPAGARTEAGKQTSRTSSASLPAIDPGDSDILRVHRTTADTAQVRTIVLRALACVPRSAKQELVRNGVTVVITPTDQELNPDSAQSKPRGYIHGGGIDNAPGYYSPRTKQIVIPERVSIRNSPPQLNLWAGQTMLHEMGHALDDCRGQISASQAFREAYEAENARVSNTVREKEYYFTQGGDVGPSELFAELFAVDCASRIGMRHKGAELRESFPRCADLIRKSLHE